MRRQRHAPCSGAPPASASNRSGAGPPSVRLEPLHGQRRLGTRDLDALAPAAQRCQQSRGPCGHQDQQRARSRLFQCLQQCVLRARRHLFGWHDDRDTIAATHAGHRELLANLPHLVHANRFLVLERLHPAHVRMRAGAAQGALLAMAAGLETLTATRAEQRRGQRRSRSVPCRRRPGPAAADRAACVRTRSPLLRRSQAARMPRQQVDGRRREVICVGRLGRCLLHVCTAAEIGRRRAATAIARPHLADGRLRRRRCGSAPVRVAPARR